MSVGQKVAAAVFPHGGDAAIWLGYAIDKYVSMKLGGDGCI
jgi:hypothetical protein